MYVTSPNLLTYIQNIWLEGSILRKFSFKGLMAKDSLSSLLFLVLECWYRIFLFIKRRGNFAILNRIIISLDKVHGNGCENVLISILINKKDENIIKNLWNLMSILEIILISPWSSHVYFRLYLYNSIALNRLCIIFWDYAINFWVFGCVLKLPICMNYSGI